MHATRVPFDPQAAFVVACDDFHICGQRFERGAPFPWRDVGIEEHDLGLLWLTLKIDVAPEVAEAPPPPPEKPKKQPQPRR